jgi:hypothetical protein
MHIDETEVRLKGESGYVCVITSVDEVYYMYRPNREGGFLRELLKECRGVVVSDFYVAYDALPNHQQKCILHLMRDTNQLILNNPFDQGTPGDHSPFRNAPAVHYHDLILLSVFETCRYRGTSFLKFLVSREVNLVGYRDRKKPKASRPLLETFPDGYATPTYANLVERQKRRPFLWSTRRGTSD